MATRGWEVSRCFLNNFKRKYIVFVIFLIMSDIMNKNEENPTMVDLNNVDEARKAFIASEIFTRKYE